jgi:carboxypeptidase-like protein
MKRRLAVASLHNLTLKSTITKRLLLGFIISFSLVCVKAQTSFTIKGTVTDDKGAPLSSASVILKGTKIGIITNSTGNYSFTINKKGTLVFSYAGYENKEVDVTEDQMVNVSLTPGNVSLNDVVVTGYSRQSKRDVTGAASTVSADVIAKTPVSDVTLHYKVVLQELMLMTRVGALISGRLGWRFIRAISRRTLFAHEKCVYGKPGLWHWWK